MSQWSLPCLTFFFFFAARRSLLFCRPHTISIVPTHDEEGVELCQTVREQKASKIEKHIYDAGVFVLSTVLASYFCIGADFTPWYMGGEGNLHKHLNTSNLPFTPLNPNMSACAMGMLGYRFEALFTTIFYTSH